jgi:Fe-S-cluster containining protein
MADELSRFFEEYETLAAQMDAVFEKIRQAHPDCVSCAKGCSDCCHAMFDLSLVEAMYVNRRFNERYQGLERSAIQERADASERENVRIKRNLFRLSQEGKTEREVFQEAGKIRMRCPLLNDRDQCDLYEHRPITCRLYGVPTSVGGEAHTCNLAAFKPGAQYPAVSMDALWDRLLDISRRLVESLDTRHKKLHEVIVPVASALLNAYDDEYLGTGKEPESHKGPGGRR